MEFPLSSPLNRSSVSEGLQVIVKLMYPGPASDNNSLYDIWMYSTSSTTKLHLVQYYGGGTDDDSQYPICPYIRLEYLLPHEDLISLTFEVNNNAISDGDVYTIPFGNVYYLLTPISDPEGVIEEDNIFFE